MSETPILDGLRQIFPDAQAPGYRPGNLKVRREDVIRAYQETPNKNALARGFGVSWSTIDYIISGRRRPHPNIDPERAWQFYQHEGITLKDVAVAFGITADAGAIGRLLREHFGEHYKKLAKKKRRNQSQNKRFFRAKAFELFQVGWTLAQIADHYGVTVGAIAHALQLFPGYDEIAAANSERSRFKPGTQPHNFKFSSYDEAFRLYMDGWTLSAIATHFGISKTTIANGLKTLPGYKKAVRSRRFRAQGKDALHLYQKGWSLKRIGTHFGVNQSTVHRELRKLKGFKPRMPTAHQPWRYRRSLILVNDRQSESL